jgi:hypothetical protein
MPQRAETSVVGQETVKGGGSSAGGASGEFGDKALNSAFDKMDSLEADLDKIDMNSKDGPKQMMQIQQKIFEKHKDSYYKDCTMKW